MYRREARWDGREGQTNPSIFPNPPTMSVLQIPTGPPITENKHTYRVHKWKARGAEAPVTKWQRGSITYNREKGRMAREWANEDAFLAWLAAEESEKSIELVVSQIERSDSLIWRERRVLRCTREYTGGKPDHANANQKERMIPSKKTGCRCRLTIKRYPHTETILGKYEDQHDHVLGDANLRFTRLSDATKELVMYMVHIGIDSKAIVCGNYITFFISGLTATVQQKRVRESCTRSQRDYHITTRDINRLRRIVENNDIHLDNNDAILVRVWVTRLQQAGGEASLKDRLDPPPLESGLSPDSFVLCIQTKFQKEQFRALGSGFLSIDATHNTTQYAGLQLFTLIVRDLWGHGTLCGAFPLLVTNFISA